MPIENEPSTIESLRRARIRRDAIAQASRDQMDEELREILELEAADDFPGWCGGHDLPRPMKRNTGKPRKSPNDPISQRIAFLLFIHSDVDAKYPNVDLVRLTPSARRELLAEIERTLGIPA